MTHTPTRIALGLALLGTVSSFSNATEHFAMSGRHVEINEYGQILFRDAEKAALGDLSLAFFIPTWWQRDNRNATDVKIERVEGENRASITGAIPLPKPASRPATFKQSARWNEQALTLDVVLEIPADAVLMPNSRPFMQLTVPIEKTEGKRALLGKQVVDLPVHNAHGWGKTFAVEAVDLSITTQADTGISSWGERPRSTHSSFRINLIETSTGDPDTLRYTSHLVVEFKTVSMRQATPRDLWAEKAGNYRRLLTNPNERPLDTTIPLTWLASAETVLQTVEPTAQARKEAGAIFDQIENWLDLRSRVYDLSDHQRHLHWFSSIHPLSGNIEDAVHEAYTLLNAGSLDTLGERLPEWEQQRQRLHEEALDRHGSPFLPASTPNPYGWIKEYSTLGFRKHPEGVLNLEPSPMNVSWFDGLSVQWFKLGEKASLEASDEAYVDVLWDAPAPVSTERSWVTTEWLRGDSRFTASVLTPLLDMRGTDHVTLSGLGSASRLTYLKPDALLRHVNLGREPRVRFDDAPSARNWLLLHGDGFVFAIIMGAFPDEVVLADGVVQIKLQRESFISVVRLSPLIQNMEQYREAEFWGRVALALPVQAVETTTGTEVTYTYIHLDRTDDWGTAPLRIAPVPPLAVNGRLPLPGVQTTSYHTKYGLYAYLPGNQVRLSLPDTFGNRTVLRGVNAAAVAKETEIETFARDGADWVRMFIQTHWEDPEDAYTSIEAQLAVYKRLGLKALLDPHNFQYRTSWSTGMPTDPAEEARFLAMWDRLSQIGARNREAVAGYDLYNELHIKPGTFPVWADLAQRTIAVIRANDPETPIYVTGSDMANPSGYFDAMPLDDPNIVHSFHFYTPHSFTHQMVQSRGRSGSAYLFYPGWITPMDWTEATHFGGGGLGWYDRWTLGAAMLPVFEFQTRHDLPLHCGEFGVIGYANPRAPVSGRLWTRDTVDWLERYRIGWHIWNMGFGLRHPGVMEDMLQRWQAK